MFKFLSFYKDTSYWILYELMLTWIQLQRPYFQIRARLQDQHLGFEHIFLEDAFQPTVDGPSHWYPLHELLTLLLVPPRFAFSTSRD